MDETYRLVRESSSGVEESFQGMSLLVLSSFRFSPQI